VVKAETGSALVLALVTLLVIVATVLIVASYLDGLFLARRLDERTVRLGALSDSAFAETLARLSDDKYFAGVEERPFGGGQIGSSVTEESSNRVVVKAWGRRAGWRGEITAEVLVGRPPRVLSWRRGIEHE
jgi:hypothetical protein